MQRVLILCEYASLNGGERSLLSVVGHLAEHGFEPTLAAPPAGPLADAARELRIPAVPFTCEPPETQADRRHRLHQLLAANTPDLVHANSLSMSRLVGPVVHQPQIPSVGHLRDMMGLSGQAVRDLNQLTRLLAVSSAVKRWYVDAGIDEDRIAVLYNGVDLQRFRPRPPTGSLSRELQLPPSEHLIVSIGQIGMRKGVEVLVNAASQVLWQKKDVCFLHVGSRFSQKQEAVDYEIQVRSAADDLAGRFRWLGRREDVPSIMNEASLVVHAARQEPLGRVLLEAAASGTPVVATNVGGTPEIFPPGCEAARLVEPDRPDAMSAMILEVLGDESLRGQMAAAGRRLAEQRFDARAAAAGLAREYQLAVKLGKVS